MPGPRRGRLRAAAQLLLFILVCQLAGAVGAWTTVTGDSAWYEALDKPVFTPPDWLFGPVWITLYALMGTAAFLVWRRGTRRWGVKGALVLFGVQLVLNAAWTPIFFGAHDLQAATVVIGLLLAVLLVTVWRFFHVSRPAGWLLVPYVLWVAYATVLTVTIWRLNLP
jgi:benzodiazapine receptor